MQFLLSLSSVISFCYILLFTSTSKADLAIVTTNNAGTLSNALLSDDTHITYVSSVFTGSSSSSGTFTGGPFNIHDGVILTTGLAASAIIGGTAQNPVPGTNNNVGGNALCGLANGGDNGFDAALIDTVFATTLGIQGIKVSFVFASAEYPKSV